jgi:hypothetical protein
MSPSTPTSTTADARVALGDLVLAARTLALRLAAAEVVQWERPARPRPAPGEEGAARSATRGTADPTAEIALDASRLALRRAVQDGEQALRAAVRLIEEQDRRLALAEVRWTGTTTADVSAQI